MNGLAVRAADVHLWTWALSLRPDDLQLLSPDELARAEGFHRTPDRDCFIAGRAQLRRILGFYLGRAPGHLAFQHGVSGRPSLPGGFRFDLSHSSGLASLAVARGFDIGIDVERVRAIADDEAVRFLSREELARLRALPAKQRADGFFRCWTRKQAYAKAVGDGLRIPFDAFAVSVRRDEPARIVSVAGDPAEAARWKLHHFTPAPGFVGAIAARHLGWRVQPVRWSPSAVQSDSPAELFR